MATDRVSVCVSIHTRWWLRWYLAGVLMAAQLTGLQPDPQRVQWWVSRGIRMRVERRVCR